jgi:hypothetical protein
MIWRDGMKQRSLAVRVALSALALLACATPAPSPVFVDSDPDRPVPEGMRRLERSGFGAAWVRTDAALAHYDALRLVYPDMTYRTPPRQAFNGRLGWYNYALSEGLAREFKSALEESFGHELAAASGWRPEAAQGERVLTVRVSVVDLVVHAPLVLIADDTNTWVNSAGEATVVIDLFDEPAKRWIARFAERDSIEPVSTRPIQATPAPALYEASRVFRLWARKLRLLLEALESSEVERLAADR